jgi:2,4-dienoyl-CoA reductase-like NADH-dependent reductase (Old Yellow Enzyme family)
MARSQTFIRAIISYWCGQYFHARLLTIGLTLLDLDWTEGGWNGDDTVRVSKLLKELGVDVVDCSTGGAVLNAQVSLREKLPDPFFGLEAHLLFFFGNEQHLILGLFLDPCQTRLSSAVQ